MSETTMNEPAGPSGSAEPCLEGRHVAVVPYDGGVFGNCDCGKPVGDDVHYSRDEALALGLDGTDYSEDMYE